MQLRLCGRALRGHESAGPVKSGSNKWISEQAAGDAGRQLGSRPAGHGEELQDV